MFKFIKKATSALLASLMCIPAGIVNISHAAESNPDGSCTVTLTDTENGLIQFSEDSMNNSSASQDGYQMMHINDDGEMEEIENDGSLWAFKAGDEVEIECIPDDGYYVETLALKDSETGKTLSQADTVDNVFSFSMPEKNISVEAIFSSTATINIKDEKKSKSSDNDIEYHDIVEDMDISKEEVEEVVADVITESYIKSNLDEKYATVGDKISLANILVVKNSIFDGAYVEEDDTIDSIMSSIENGDKDIEKNAKKFVSQLDSCVIVYDLGKENDYYVAYANTMIKDTAYIVQDYAIAVNNNNGELVEGCIYDEETGLLYIPKDLYMGEEGKDIFLYLQIQFMQVFNKISRSDDESMTSELHTISVDEDKEQVELSSYSQEIFSLQTSINVEKGMDAENLNVVVNGFPMKKDAYTYNPETGELVVAVSPASVNSIEVTENESALSDELLDFMEKSEAVTLNSGAGMPAKKKITVDSMDDIPTEGWGGVIPVRLQYHHTRGDNPNLENVWIAWTGGNNDVDTTAFINALINNTDISFSNLVGRDNPFDILFDSYADSLEFSAFLKQIGTVGANCAHVSTPIPDFNVDNSSGSNGVTDLAPGEGKIYIKVIDRQDNKPEKGKATGYIVLGMFTRKSGDQIGNAVIRIDYEAEVKDAVDPIYLYMFKKSVEDVPKIGSATLNGAEYEMLFYSKQHFGSAENAVKKGSQTARFVFSTKEIKDDGPGSPEYKRVAKFEGIDAEFGIDFFPKVNDEGEFIYDEAYLPDEERIQNDFLVEGHDEYAQWFGAEGTYVIREIRAPHGYLMVGNMSGYQTDKETNKLREGLALDIVVNKTDDGNISHTYKLNGQKVTERIINVENEADPGLALITNETPDSPDMKSEAVCLDTNQQYAGSAYGTISVQDTVTIDTLEKISAKYFVTTKLYDLGTEDNRTDIPLSVSWKKKSNYSEGNKTGKEFKTEFSTGADGHVNAGSQVQFKVGATVDISDLKGHTLVFVNYLLVKQGADGSGSAIWGKGENDGLGKASSKDDKMEQIYIIDGISTSIIGTDANRKAGTGESIIYAGKDQALKDTITYTNLEKKRPYIVKYWLVDAETGNMVGGIREEKRTASASGSGTWDVPFNFDATDSKGKKYVAYVEVYENDHLIVDHKEINDKKETFLVPKITTKLRCEETNTNIAENGPTINFEDTITYKNLIPNANYKVETVVMDLGTGKELVDARGSKASVRDADKTFTPSSSNGEHKVHFSIAGVRTDGNNIVTNTLAGKTIVVYQYLYIEKNSNGSKDWVLIADHADINDKDQSAPIKGSGPLYLYLYKRNAGGNTYDNADLSNARFEVAFYKDQKFGSALEATKKGSLTATFTFRTGLANDAGLGSAPYREAAGRTDINAKYGIDCYPKVDESGNFLYEEDGDGNRLFQNDFLTSDKAEYTRYFGQAGTYVVREVEPPVGFSLSGTMEGYGSGKAPTTKLSEGLALYVAEMVNSEGKIIHQYSVDGKVMDDPIISTDNDWIPKDEKGAAIITDDNPEYPEISTSAICLDTNQQYADSQSRAVSILDKIKVKTLPKVDAQYKVTTKIYDLNDKKFIEAHWKKKSDYSEPDKTGDAFETTFSTANDGINAGDTVRFEVGAIVDGTALKGHTIVFINYHKVTERADGSGRVIWGADAEGNVLNGGLGVATSMDDKLEMLTFPNQKTDIISTQNGRKGLDGEGIIYAGMYKDDTLQEGHGTRFQVLNDTIYYKNYEPGREYTVKAWLMDVKTQAPALDANNNEIFNMQATQKQIASETGEGTWDISFEFDATGCGDRKYVSYVEISLGSELVADYKDLGDESESFLIPKITTKLKDNETGLDVSYAGETVSLTDTISYSRMMVGADYKVKTKVIDVETKKELVDVHGETVEVPEQVFTAASESGTWDIPISFAALVKNPDGTIKNTLAGKTIVVYEYVYIEKNSNGSGQWVLIADHEDFEDGNQRAYLPYIDTLALDEKTRNHISNAEKGLKIHDTVNYKKLNPKYKYKLVSELRDKSTGEIVVDDSGTEQVITTPVTIDAVDGTIKPEKEGVIFDLNAESFAGRTLVVFERLYLLNGESSFLVADHEDILDEDQTDYIPKVWTRAMVEDIFATASPDRARIIDTFSYDNLIPGLTYKLKGKVVDKNSTIHAGTDILAGGASKNELVFQPESSSGSVRLSFDVNKQNNGVFVVFEELYLVTSYDGADHEILVAKHTDIGDLNQTVYINPTLETSLLDAGTKTKVLDAKEDALLTDTITYKGFDPRLSYVIRGQLIDMETGSVLTDSKDVRVEAEMDAIPDSTGSGQWVMEYKFDASKLAGKIIVAYEEVYEKTGAGTRLVAAHRDFWDKEQRVIIPIIDTVALNPKTNGHIADAEGNMIITDRVYYSHLELDTEYRLISKLIDKETGEVVVDDKGILQEMETSFSTRENTSQEKYVMELQDPFDSSDVPRKAYAYGYIIPEDGNRLPDGTEYNGIVFQLDGHTFEGRTLVVFEELQKRTPDGYVTVARHMDINDRDQTIHIPKIRTHAFDSETGTNISKMDGFITIHDYVTYENLLPGQTYVLKACLMDKPDSDTKTESPIRDANGDKIEGTLEFVPDSPNGTIGPVLLQGNADHFMTDEGEFSSETLVVYEELYLKNSRDASDELLAVADHKDINDENQTIYHPAIRTKAVAYNLGEEPKDGDRNHVIGFAAYKCDYCGTKFYTMQEAEAHLRQSQICQRKGSYSLVTKATVYDTVYYENLMPNRTYEIVGHLIDVRTGKVVKVNQQQVQADKKYFTPGSANGEVDVVFHVDSLELAGGRYAVYEELFLDGVSIADHKDKWDKDQTFYVPDVHTSAKATATNSHIANVDTDAEIIDTVELAGLEENQEYYLRSALVETTMNSGNYGNPFVDASGKTVQPTGWRKKGESAWHPMDEKFSIQKASSTENYSGSLTLEVRFVVDLRTTNTGVSFKDRKFVVFQELFLPNGTLVGQHKDLLDEQQTIYTGGIHTTAVSSATRSHLMEATEGQWMVDTIYYSGLDSGSSYYVTTNVYVKEDSNPVSGVMKNIEPINQGSLTQAKFVASRTGSGTWNINIALPDLSKYAGKTLVVYEEIRKGATDGETVAYENNLYNEAQSVHIVGMSTLEKDNINNKNGIHYTNAAYQWVCNGCKEAFDSQAEADRHIMAVYKCDNCELEFNNKTDAEKHIHGECKKATVLRDTQLVRKENGNVVAEDWYQCSGCSKRFATNQECLDHIHGSDICYSYQNANKEHHSYDAVASKITDTVTYKNLIPGRKYRVEGRIYNVDTDEFVQDGDSDYTVSKTFTTYTSANTIDMEFELDATELAGYKYAVYERLYDITPRYDSLTATTLTEPVLIASHEDPADKDQAFFIPKVETSVMDDYTKTNVTRADTTTTLYDTVRFEGLNVGSSDKYIIEGIVMDAETMEPLVLSNGEHATASTGEFTVKRDASGSDLEKTLEFTFSTSYLEGKTLVIFERLYLSVNASTKVLIGQHTEIMDEKQTTYIPMVRTYAYDFYTDEQVSGADESVTIVDKVVCSNLVKGKRYRLQATLVDPDTGKVLKDASGHEITGTLDLAENNYNEFTASSTGRETKTVKFVFDGSNLAGKTAVVHETLLMQTTTGAWETIAYHNPLPDVNDESKDMDYRNQRIVFPEISTSAKDKATKTEFVKNSEKATVVDTVTYKNLIGGLEYKLVGTIYDLKHENLLEDSSGNTYTVTKYFHADESGNGTEKLEFTFNTKDMVGKKYVIYEELFLNDESIASHKDSNDKKQTFQIPKIKTSTLSEDLKKKMTFADDDVVIIDTVTYENLIPDREYKVNGILMDKATKEPLLDAHGNEIHGTATFVPESENGTVEVTFRFDGTNIAGVTAVAYEELLYLDAVIADHKDINDHEQTIYIPRIKTSAVVNETDKTHIGVADSIMTITDTISYENLMGDEKYYAEGIIMDRETGKPALDANGNEVKASADFQTAHPDAESKDKTVSGTVDVEFEFDATGMRGKTFVIYESVYWVKSENTKLEYKVAEHTEIMDEKQSIHIPEIGTKAMDSETRTHITKADDCATIIDTVTYKNLHPGKEYTLEAVLIDLDNSNKVATDDYGVEIKATTTFIPKAWDGEVQVRFDDYEMEKLAGHTLVCYEYLKYKGTLIDYHTDPSDEEQTIHLPKIKTSASSADSDVGNVMAEGYETVVDEIRYWNLVPNIEYIIKGVIMDKATGQPAIDADGNKIMGSKIFTPTSADGTVNVEFTFNATGMEDKDFVVFEEIFYKGDLHKEVSIAEHSDLQDEEQSVYVPKILTNIIDDKAQLKVALAQKGMSFTDTVRYKGLIPNTQYRLIGTLYDFATKQPALDDNGNVITASKEFTASSKQGHETVTFEFDGKNLEGHTLVAVEELQLANGKKVAEHHDLEDKDQTVYVPKARTEAVDTETSINYSYADNKVTIKDTIMYENLVKGYSYTAHGVLVDRKTKEPVLDVNGNKIEAERAFVVNSPNGSIEITFTFDATGFDGKTYNVFEEISCNGKVVAEHKDTNDEKQNVHFPELSTNALDNKTKTQHALAEGSMDITDIVTYKNLKAGEEYVATGILMDKTTGFPVLDPSININPDEVLDNIKEHWTCDQCGELFTEKEKAMEHIDKSATDACETFTLVLSYDIDDYNALIESATIKATTTFVADDANGEFRLNFSFDGTHLAGHTLVAYVEVKYNGKDIASHKDIDDQSETIYIPDIETTATDKSSGLHVIKAGEDVSIVDKVKYTNLMVGTEYVVRGTLMNKSTGNAIEDEEGEAIVAETTFMPEKANGYVDVLFHFNSSNFAGDTFVVFEQLMLKQDTEKVIAKHEDLEDEKQTVTVPAIETRAFDSTTKENVVMAGETTTIIDRVYYHNLTINEVYKVSGILMDKKEGKPITDKDGNEIRAEKTFTARDRDGYVDIEFVFNAKDFADYTLVAFEELSYKGHIIGEHKDIEDEEQTVYLPKIGTMARDKKTGTHMAYLDDVINIIDTVSYSNIAPDKEYTVSGYLVDGETGKALTEEVQKTFKPTAASGSIEVEFSVSKDKIKGRKVVVFEELRTKFVIQSQEKETYTCKQCNAKFDSREKAAYHFEDSKDCYSYSVSYETINKYGEEVTIAEHKDIGDANQTVYVPEIYTTAKDAETNTKLSYGKGEITIVDTIHYSGLQTGIEYKAVGTLMDKSGKEVLVDGEKIVAEATFTPETSNGTVDVVFKFKADGLAGEALVAFEELYVNGELIADHKDPEDEEQTVYIPEIGTKATDKDTGEHIGKTENATVVDTVEYHNLIPGLQYTIKGVLMDKETGKPYIVADVTPDNGSKGIVAEATFIPEQPDGEIQLVFDVGNISDKTLVAFEELYFEDKLIADHKDIEDEEQTVHFPEIRTHASSKETGDKVVPSKEETIIVDKVTYKNLIVGKEYTINGTLMKKNGESTGYTASKTFVAKATDGEVELEFVVKTSDLAGQSVVAFESLVYEGIELTTHADLTDEDQTVDIPEIETHASDELTQMKVVSLGEKVNIIDVVTYRNLTPGIEYTISGQLMLKGADGTAKETGITASTTFIPEEMDGEITLTFVVDSTQYAGMALVAYEKLFDKNVEIATHEDPEDENQTVYVPEIKTHASANGNSIAPVSKETKIIDVVTYKNLVPNLSYTLNGVLMDKATGKEVLVDGNKVTATKTFIPKEKDGEVTLEFTFDSTGFDGNSVVVYEELEMNHSLVAEHKDINDENQTVRFPEIATHAVDEGTNTKVVTLGESVVILDRVTYRNLVVGKEYTIHGTLMLKGENGATSINIMAAETFTATSSDGEITLKFKVDSTKYAGMALVAYEKLFDKEVEIATHEDPEDEDQTVYVPEIKTNASVNGKSKAEVSKKTTIVDKITYKNLVPGVEYIVSGKLVNKANGKTLSVNKKAITSTAKFTPKTPNGSVEIKFTFDSSACDGMSIVVFENLSVNGKIVATHSDINDKNQTVTLEKPKKPEKPEKPDKPNKPEEPDKPEKPEEPDTPDEPDKPNTPEEPDTPSDREKYKETVTDEDETPKKVKTGDNYTMIVFVFVATIAVLGCAIIVIKKKK